MYHLNIGCVPIWQMKMSAGILWHLAYLGHDPVAVARCMYAD